MSTLAVTYTPQYAGDHRVCYRLADQSPAETYCCVTDSTPSTPGVPKTLTITITDTPCGTVPSPDPESCINQTYEGYVQPACVDESSSENQVFWSVTFLPDPSCVNNNVCCQGTTPLITGYLFITNAGSGYDDTLSPLTVAVIRDGSDPVPPGGGNDAIVEATITGGVITAVTVGATGGLYGKIPTFIIPPPTLPGPVTATMAAAIPCTGGTKYFEDCDGNAQSTILGLGQCAVFCFPKGTPFLYDAPDLITPDSSNYAYTNGGCCNCTTCRNYTVTMNDADAGGLVAVMYTRCTTPLSSPPQDSDFETVNMQNGVPVNITCMVPNSLFAPDHSEATFDIVDNGECTDCIS